MSQSPAQPLMRDHALDELRKGVDILVIGGGIVGSGVARDAAMRGLRVALVDAHDFAFGTSSRSSRLLHGGLRYLAQGRIGLVREASVEKMIIHRIAPHLAQPLPFIFPTYRGTKWKYWKLRMGVKIYDLLCGKRNLGKSSGMSPGEVLRQLPLLNPAGLTGAVRYFDGLTNDARLVIDTIRSAASNGALALNFTVFHRARQSAAGWDCELEDLFTNQSIHTTTRSIVNAAGAWAATFPQSAVKLRLTKGIHLVIDRARLPVPDAVVMTDGRRILFCIPWGQRLILGTTDTDYAGPLENPSADADDINYILRIVNRNFSAGITSDDVISFWSGLRPLIADSYGAPSDISRAHQIDMPAPGWFDVAGGKLTTYRLMAEQTVDRVIDHLGIAASVSRTAEVPLLPDPADAQYSGILPPPISQAAVAHYCHGEWAHHLDDVMVRRTSWRYYHADHLEIAGRVARWMGAELNWTAQRITEELDRYRGMAGDSPIAATEHATPCTAP